MKAARYIRCPPWEIEDGISRLIWRMIANEAELAELKWRASLASKGA